MMIKFQKEIPINGVKATDPNQDRCSPGRCREAWELLPDRHHATPSSFHRNTRAVPTQSPPGGTGEVSSYRGSCEKTANNLGSAKRAGRADLLCYLSLLFFPPRGGAPACLSSMLLLLAGDIERNPGPRPSPHVPTNEVDGGIRLSGLCLLQWNAGGLSAAKLGELRRFLNRADPPCDVVVIQETHLQPGRATPPTATNA